SGRVPSSATTEPISATSPLGGSSATLSAGAGAEASAAGHTPPAAATPGAAAAGTSGGGADPARPARGPARGGGRRPARRPPQASGFFPREAAEQFAAAVGEPAPGARGIHDVVRLRGEDARAREREERRDCTRNEPPARAVKWSPYHDDPFNR